MAALELSAPPLCNLYIQRGLLSDQFRYRQFLSIIMAALCNSRTSPKWPVLSRVGRKTFNSVNQSRWPKIAFLHWLEGVSAQYRQQRNQEFYFGGLKPMASAEREAITGVWGQSPQRGPGAEPLVRGAKPPEAESFFVDVRP